MQVLKVVSSRSLCDAAAVVALLAVGCGGQPAKPATQAASASTASTASVVAKSNGAADTTPSPIRFEEVSKQWGVDFRQVSGNSPEKHFPAANSSGVAAFDFDGDGRIDLYFLTARPMPFKEGTSGPNNRLFRNELPGGFEDVSAPSGLEFSAFCHGVLAADFDNDGFSDLAISRYRGTRLYRNNGDGTFSATPIESDGWGSSLAAIDIDEDGRLDIYVTHYGIWSIDHNEKCGNGEVRTFCSPKRISPTEHAMFHSDDGWKFRDVLQEAGLGRRDGRGQGVCVGDLNNDGHLDLWVANDLCPNFVYLGDGKGKFRDVSLISGAATNTSGMEQAGMGTDCEDVDRDGLPDLFVTNFRNEYNALYVNQGEGFFIDRSHAAGVAIDSRNTVNWGTKLCDFDNDGWLDLFVSTGHVDDNISEITPGAQYRTNPMIWRNGSGKFSRLKGDSAGEFFTSEHCGRGVAVADFDNDGWPEFAVNNVDEGSSLVHNVSPGAKAGTKPWIRVSLTGTISNRDAVGAKVIVQGEGLPPNGLVRQRTSGGSYLSSHDPRILVGVGEAAKSLAVTVKWPSGAKSELKDVKPGAELNLVEPLQK